MIKSKFWVIGYFVLVMGTLGFLGVLTVKIDPLFHYHKPDTEKYFYSLDSQRNQNDGITKEFAYNALITGTSMTENFKTSEMDSIFGTKSIKVPYSGGTYKEINDNLINALSYNPNLKIIIRSLDMNQFFDDKEAMRTDMGKYPTYLYDKNIFNDVKYIFNRDVIFKRVYPMVLVNGNNGIKPGITSFDTYSNWMNGFTFGIHTIYPNGVYTQGKGAQVHLTVSEQEVILDNIRQNVTSLAEKYSNVTFYYFITPYSIAWWQPLVTNGTVYKQIEAEKLVIEEILKCSNIKLYSFNNLTNITTDLNNYKDTIHYGSWINSMMLHYMYDDKCLLTYDNYERYLEEEVSFYTSYDYEQLNEQIDYENDYYAEALLNEEINGVTPIKFSEEMLQNGELNSANIILNLHNGAAGVECTGYLQREPDSEISISDYVMDTEYIGCKITIDDISDYKYLVFYGMRKQGHGQPSIYIYNDVNENVATFTKSYHELDDEWHQYLIDISQLSGNVTVIFNGGYVDNTGRADSLYYFSDISLY